LDDNPGSSNKIGTKKSSQNSAMNVPPWKKNNPALAHFIFSTKISKLQQIIVPA
jgi:hypothetical protein